jgi:hypothetical protein
VCGARHKRKGDTLIKIDPAFRYVCANFLLVRGEQGRHNNAAGRRLHSGLTSDGGGGGCCCWVGAWVLLLRVLLVLVMLMVMNAIALLLSMMRPLHSQLVASTAAVRSDAPRVWSCAWEEPARSHAHAETFLNACLTTKDVAKENLGRAGLKPNGQVHRQTLGRVPQGHS